MENTDELLENYKIHNLLGKGSFGSVFKVESLRNSNIYALKICFKENKENLDLFEIEFKILIKLKHKNIIKCYEYKNLQKIVYLKLEYLEQSLKDFILNNQMNETVYSSIIKHIFNAFSYLHHNKIIHRDIKPDNIMFKLHNNLDSLKIIDFGLSARIKDNNKLFKKCGTLVYAAPEVLSDHEYYKPADIFSLGVVVYWIISKGNKHPFIKNQEDFLDYKKNFNESYLNDIEFDENFNDLSINFIKKLIVWDSSFRYSADQALEHPFISLKERFSIPLTSNESVIAFQMQRSIIELIKASLILNFLIENSEKKTKSIKTSTSNIKSYEKDKSKYGGLKLSFINSKTSKTIKNSPSMIYQSEKEKNNSTTYKEEKKFSFSKSPLRKKNSKTIKDFTLIKKK